MPTTYEVPEGTFAPERRFSLKKLPWGSIFLLSALIGGALLIIVACVQLMYASRIQTDSNRLQSKPVAIVLGASVKNDQTPSDALNDRILSAVKLYEQGTVKKLLMTGDDGKNQMDEVSVMVKTAVEAGVPEKDILVDGQGYRTYESCKRAITEFNVTRAIIVTQRFHIGRALFLCNQIGIDADGFVADRQPYQKSTYFWARDMLSSVKAFWDIFVSEPKTTVKVTDITNQAEGVIDSGEVPQEGE